jgi:arylsulfatase
MGGYGLYLTNGKPAFIYNFLDLQRFQCEGQHALSVGKHNVEFDYTYEGPGLGKGGSGELKVDGHTVATLKMPHSVPFLFPVNETFDVGLDTRSSVIGKDNLMPFRSIGNIDKLTVKLGPVRMAEAEHKQMQYALANAKD